MSDKGLYILLISPHGLIRGENLELGRDADTGGQTKYVVELARALGELEEVERVDLVTRLVSDSDVSADYAQHLEPLSAKASIVRITAGPDGYIPKEQLWDHLASFSDNLIDWLRQQSRLPDILHSHYADAGFIAVNVSNQTGIPVVHTGHSLGRDKKRRLLALGMTQNEINEQFNMVQRIEAEEMVLANAELVITSSKNEIIGQYEIYDFYDPDCMAVIPPGIDLDRFHPPRLGDPAPDVMKDIRRFLDDPDKPMILALSRPDGRKNLSSLMKAYGQSSKLQKLANLVVVAGNRDDIRKMEEGARDVLTELLVLIDIYDLYGKVAVPKHHASDEVPGIYRHAAITGGVFINPALTEPFGLTLLEASACGLPVVATENGGPVDIIDNCRNGVLINPLDEAAITAGLLKLLEKPQRWRKASQNGLKNIPRFYSWHAHARQYLDKLLPVITKSKLLPKAPLTERAMDKHHRAIFTDIDQNLLGDRQSLERLLKLIRENRKTTTFGINTSRRLDSALAIMKEYAIPVPDILITSLGTEIHYAPELTPSTNWQNHIQHLWSRTEIERLMAEFPAFELQAETNQNKFKISYEICQDDVDVPALIEQVNSKLRQENQTVNVVFSLGRYLDIVPHRTSKGTALRYVASLWDIPLQNILVAGGSGADEDMMMGNTRAVVVANRHAEELSESSDTNSIYFAEKPFADGILEAIEHYRFFRDGE